MRLALLVPCLLSLLATAARADDAAAPGDLGLADAVDLPTPAERRKAARALARRRDVGIEDWLAVMRAFRPRADRATSGTVEAALPVLDRTEQTELVLLVPEAANADAAASDRAVPLVVALHGAGGTGGQALNLWREVAESLGACVLAPGEAGANAGYGYEPRERASVLAAMRWARRRLDIDENRIHLTGVSRGGHLAWDLATRAPDRFASLAPMIGGPRFEVRQGTNNLRYLENLVPVPIRDLQGEQDHPVLVWSLRLAFARLEKLGATDAKLLTWPDLGHSFRFEAVDWKAFLESAKRDPAPARVVRVATRTDEARAYWAEIVAFDRGVKESFVERWPPGAFEAMDEEARRLFVVRAGDERAARLEVRMMTPGVFDAKSRLVKRFRLLLTPAMLARNEPVRVTWNGKTITKRVKPDVRVLLEDFVERFDRTFLPVAEVRIP